MSRSTGRTSVVIPNGQEDPRYEGGLDRGISGPRLSHAALGVGKGVKKEISRTVVIAALGLNNLQRPIDSPAG